jgi:hypothetical protein
MIAICWMPVFLMRSICALHSPLGDGELVD